MHVVDQLVDQRAGHCHEHKLSDIQERAINFARQNFEASFSLATDLARAKDIAAVLDVQKRFAQSQMQAYAMQAQELGGLMMTAAQRATQR